MHPVSAAHCGALPRNDSSKSGAVGQQAGAGVPSVNLIAHGSSGGVFGVNQAAAFMRGSILEALTA
jgi:hypothetical protein